MTVQIHTAKERIVNYEKKYVEQVRQEAAHIS